MWSRRIPRGSVRPSVGTITFCFHTLLILEAMCRLALFAGLGLQIAAALQAATLVTAKTNISLTPSGGSFAAVFSPDGGYLIFQSYANNLVTNDSEGAYLDLFLHEFATDQTRLISTSPQGPAGATASADYPSIS